MDFIKETFSRDFNRTLARVGAVLVVVYGIGVIAAKVSKS